MTQAILEHDQIKLNIFSVSQKLFGQLPASYLNSLWFYIFQHILHVKEHPMSVFRQSMFADMFENAYEPKKIFCIESHILRVQNTHYKDKNYLIAFILYCGDLH